MGLLRFSPLGWWKKGAARVLNVFGARGSHWALEFAHTHLHCSLWAAVSGAGLPPSPPPPSGAEDPGGATLAVAPL